MNIKTYQTESVPQALELIKKDLGPNAIILDTKRTQKRKFLGLIPTFAYTITAASEANSRKGVREEKATETYESASTAPVEEKVDSANGRDTNGSHPSTSIPQPSSSNGKAGSTSGLPAQISALSSEIQDLKAMVGCKSPLSVPPSLLFLRDDLMREHFRRLTADAIDDNFNWQSGQIILEEFQRLYGEGLEEHVISSLLYLATRDLTPEDDARSQLRRCLNGALAKMIRTSPLAGWPENKRGAVFLGPTGTGKTTTLAKLAATLVLGERKKVQVITLDTYRIAAAEQLKTYCDIIGVPLQVVSSVAELGQAVADCQKHSRILIDTAGRSHKQVDELGDLASYLCSSQDLEKHLVLSATTKSEDVRQIIRSFEAFVPDKLVFTKLDETSTYGVIINELIRTGKSLSYMTNGQTVPDDLLIPTPTSVADLLVPLN